MKKIISTICMLFCICSFGMAESKEYILNINMTDGTIYECHLQDLSQLSFDEKKVSVDYQSQKTDFKIEEVTYYTFTDGSGNNIPAAISATKAENKRPDDGKIYTLDGKLVKDTKNLPKGTYIKNGKKYFVLR